MYLKQKNPGQAWIVDIETNGLHPTEIWVYIVKNLSTGEVLSFRDREEFNAWYRPEYILIGHNAISFDIPVLNRLWGTGIDLESCIDTLVLSYLYNPALEVPQGLAEKNLALPKKQRKGAHSLDAWGYRVKHLKNDFSDWSKYSKEMEEYCRNDVEVTCKVYKALSKRMLEVGYSELSCEIEHKIRIVIDEQEHNGCWFDEKRAREFSEFLKREQASLTEEIYKLFPPVRSEVARYAFRRTKDGRPFASYEKHRAKYADIEHIQVEDKNGSQDYYVCFELVPFNLGSPKQRIEKLLELGWTPTAWTPKGSPKVDEDALLAFATVSGEPALKALAEWLVIQGRLTMLAGNPETGSKGWLGNVRDHGQGDTRIHGRVRTCAATTRRMIHSDPNTANIPSAHKAKYGKESRSFWGVRPNQGLILVGYDAAGLETAGLCHYLNNPKATEVLLRDKPNDIHTANARRLTEALHRPIDREWGAKTSWYAWLYGAYPKKLGEIVKGPPSDGDIVIDTFFRNVPGLKNLIDEVQYEFKINGGLLRTIDGGFVRCPSLNAALNYRVQSLGSILMKLTSVLLKEEACKLEIPYKKVLDIHDEGQLQTEERFGDVLGRLAVASITKAGETLGLNVPVTGDYKLGTTWDQTH